MKFDVAMSPSPMSTPHLLDVFHLCALTSTVYTHSDAYLTEPTADNKFADLLKDTLKLEALWALLGTKNKKLVRLKAQFQKCQ